MPPVPENVDKLRGQWLAPFILSPHNPGIIYHGTQFVHRSMNEGETWELISPDLTYNQTSKKGDIPYQTIFTISESHLKFGVLYAGTDDGRVWVTQNSGSDWNEIVKGLPYGKWVSHLEASRYAKGRVYMTQNGKRDDDSAAYIWKSEDYGQTWENINANIPSGPCNVIREDPKDENILYVGTDYGVFLSTNRGESWQALVGNLPTTYVHDINIHPRDDIAVIATHGRGMWALDVRLLREVINMDASEELCCIFDIPECILPYNMQYYERTVTKLEAPFFLKNIGEIDVKVLDYKGSVVFETKFDGKRGLNNILWGLLNNEEIPVDAGTFTLQVSGKGFEQNKDFEVNAFSRW